MICHACMAVVWAFFLYDGLLALVPNTAVVCPTSRGVASEMSSRGFHVFGGSLLRCPYARSCFSAAQLSCLMLCFFLAVARFPYEGEFMLFCYTIYMVIFHAFGAATRIPNEISCFSALMRCHEISSWHLMLCLTPPMRLLCFYLMRFCAVFAAYFSGKTSSWDGLRYAISYCWRQSKDCLVRCHSCGPPDEVSSFASVVVCCIIVS
jgi:hypothetical protein